MHWRCSCGKSVLLHYEYCAACGRHRPPPPKEDKPKSKIMTAPSADLESLALAMCEDYGAEMSDVWRERARMVASLIEGWGEI